MDQYLNPFKNNLKNLQFQTLKEPIFEVGNCKIFVNISKVSHYYTIDNIIVNEIVGVNKQHLTNLAENKEPESEQMKFLFNRAKHNYKEGLKLIKNHKNK